MISSQSPSSTPCTSSYSFATPSSVTACCSSSEMPCTSSYLFATPSPVTPCSYLFATPSSVATGTSSQSSAATGTSSQLLWPPGPAPSLLRPPGPAPSLLRPPGPVPSLRPPAPAPQPTPRHHLSSCHPSPLRNKRPSSDHLLDGFLQRGCRCSSKCCLFFTREYYRTRRDQANSLATVELDMVVLGQIGACVNDEVVGPSHHHTPTDERAPGQYSKGKRICRETFLTLHAIGKEK